MSTYPGDPPPAVGEPLVESLEHLDVSATLQTDLSVRVVVTDGRCELTLLSLSVDDAERLVGRLVAASLKARNSAEFEPERERWRSEPIPGRGAGGSV